jgi:hypothetical protein
MHAPADLLGVVDREPLPSARKPQFSVLSNVGVIRICGVMWLAAGVCLGEGSDNPSASG